MSTIERRNFRGMCINFTPCIVVSPKWELKMSKRLVWAFWRHAFAYGLWSLARWMQQSSMVALMTRMQRNFQRELNCRDSASVSKTAHLRSRSPSSPTCTTGKMLGTIGGLGKNSTSVQSFLLNRESPGERRLDFSWIFHVIWMHLLEFHRRKCLFTDFVVYLGDVITANNLPYHDATVHWREAIGPAVQMDIPFASVFGNHDDAPFEWDPDSGIPPDAPKQTTSRKELMEFDTSLPSSFSLAGPNTLWPSVSNYVIPITSSGGTMTVAIMYFLDSGGGSMSEVISAHQAAWFTATASEINPDASYEFSA
uniref:Calcineurin-like phosphoesterase domain-containing protein n=1 Tax=Physcomitrium patens TaxID=3218 RepID=A0A7I4FCB6_PHYPA